MTNRVTVLPGDQVLTGRPAEAVERQRLADPLRLVVREHAHLDHEQSMRDTAS
jgi:hypothetical protein